MQFIKNIFGKKDVSIEMVTLFSASMAHLLEDDTGMTATNEQIYELIDKTSNAFYKQTLSGNHRSIVKISIEVLLDERVFIKEAAHFIKNHPGEPIPLKYQQKMLSIVERSAESFMRKMGR